MTILSLMQSALLVGGTVHSMVPGEEPRPANVLVHRGEIAAVLGPAESVPVLTDADGKPVAVEPVDVTGMHLVPGLIDGMVNFDADHDALYVASGVTLVRDQANELTRVLAARTPEARRLTPGPDLFVAGRILDGSPPVTTESVVITTIAEAENKIPQLCELGIDYFSFYQGLGQSRQGTPEGETPGKVLERICEMAHESGRRVWGPILPSLDLRSAHALGQDGLFYLDGLLPKGSTWNDLDPARLPAIAKAVPTTLALTPGMRLYAQRLEDPGEDPPELGVLGPHYAYQWQQDLDVRRNMDWERFVQAGTRVVEMQRALIAELAKNGQRILPGSAAPNPWILPGIGLHDEFDELAKAGLTPRQILESATSGAAELLGIADRRGSIQAGRVADIVAVRGNPLEKLELLREPELVCLRGRVLRRGDLDGMVDQLFERVQAIKAEAAQPIEVPPLELPEGELLLSGDVENAAHGQRISAERFAVVRQEDGTFVYVARVLTPASASYKETVLDLTQQVKDNRLVEFELRVSFGEEDSLGLSGIQVGGSMRLRQTATLKGMNAGGKNTTVSRELSFIDAGSVTAGMILARHQPPGSFYALFLEELEPITGPWTMRPGEDFTYLATTPTGAAYFESDARGTPKLCRRVRGTTVIESTLIEDSLEGPGLEVPVRPVPREGGDAPGEDER